MKGKGQEIKEMGFEAYLTEVKKFSASTMKNYLRLRKYFFLWLNDEALSVEALSYKDIIRFITHQQEKGYKKRYINVFLSAIKHYLDYLTEKEILPCNVASGLFMRGRRQSVPSGLLSAEELKELYEKYEIKTTNRQHYPSMVRNKVVTGLMVFQGLLPDEMQQLKTSDLQLEKGKINIPASGRSESRILNLEVSQLFYVQKYLSESGVKEKLFTGRMENILSNLFKKHLQFINPAVKTAMQIKMSLLTEMLKNKDLREVQVFAGHRFVSSTERYQTSHLETLKSDLEKYHVLR